jgi:hypothetical protein
MKNKLEIETELERIEQKRRDAEITGHGYKSFSDYRSDETRMNTLKWILEIPITGRPRR